MLQDLIYGLRWLRKHPGFTALSVLTLAVGIGVNTAMFSVVHAVLLKPLPYAEADRIVWMAESGPEVSNRWVSYLNFNDWRARNQVFESMSAFRGFSTNVTGTDQAENLNARLVTFEYFKVMRATPMLGRDFTEADDKTGAAPVTIISHEFWQQRFGGDPNVVGKQVMLDDRSFTVIGVMPESFVHQGPPPLWLLTGPMNVQTHTRDVRTAGNVIARLKPGVTIEQARAEMDRIAKQLFNEYPRANAGADTITVASLQDSITRNVGTALKILFGAVGLVLLIACANVANLLLARAATRRKEFAVRAALGASRWRIVRQLLIESLLLGLTGGVVGLLFASWAMSFLQKVAHDTVPRMTGVNINGRVLAFNIGASILTGILFGLAPALRFSKTDLQETLKDSASTTSDGRGKKLRSALVVSEVAVSVALLIGAGLMVKSLVTLLKSDNGFDPNGVLTMEVKVSRGHYRKPADLSRFLQQVLDTVRSQPGVENASISGALPGVGDGDHSDIAPEGHRSLKPGEQINVEQAVVSADFFQTMKIALLRGRTFTRDEDEQGKPVVLVDENLARRFWPTEDAVGKRLAYDGPHWHEIIGVVQEVRDYGSQTKPLITMYTPLGRSPQRNSTLSVRYDNTDPQALTAAVTRAINTLDKNVPVNEIATFESVLAREASPRRFNALLFAAFAALALILAATGVYGVLSYSVSQRTHEVGIRMALGAGHRDVLRLFMSDGMVLVLLGLALGLAGAFALTRLMSSLLFGASSTDLTTFVVVSVGLVLIGLFACYIPARRASKVDPLVALRYE